MKTDKILIPSTGEEIEVEIPLGIDSDTWDKMVPFIDNATSKDHKKSNDAIMGILEIVTTTPEGFNWRKADVGSAWRLMREHITPMVNTFQEEDERGSDNSRVQVSYSPETRIPGKRTLPRKNRKKLSES